MFNSVKFIAPLAIVVLLSVGCAPSAGRQLIGSWRLDGDDAVLGLLEKANIQVEFARDGKLTVSSEAPIFGSVSRSGTWKLVSSKADTANVAYQWDGEDKAKILVITIVDSDTIRLTPPLGPIKAEVPFRRVTEQRSSPATS